MVEQDPSASGGPGEGASGDVDGRGAGTSRRRRPSLPATAEHILDRLPPEEAQHLREWDERRAREQAVEQYGADAEFVLRWDRADRRREAEGRTDSLRLRCARRGCGLSLGRVSLASYGDGSPYHVLVSPVSGDELDGESYSLRCPGKACRATPYLKKGTLATRYLEAIEAGLDDLFI